MSMNNITLTNLKPVTAGDRALSEIIQKAKRDKRDRKHVTRPHESDSKASLRAKVESDIALAKLDNLESLEQRVDQMNLLGYSVHDIMPLIF